MPLRKRRRERKLEAFVVASDLPKSPGHPFSTALNRLLAENGFDPLVEKLRALLRRNFWATWHAARRLFWRFFRPTDAAVGFPAGPLADRSVRGQNWRTAE
jgi:hypothetical protein